MLLAVLSPLELIAGCLALAVAILAIRRAGRYGLYFLGALLVTCALTNPNKERHAEEIREEIVGAEKSLVGRVFVDMFADGLIEPLIDYEPFLVFSTTSINKNLLSVGFLGQVIVFSGNNFGAARDEYERRSQNEQEKLHTKQTEEVTKMMRDLKRRQEAKKAQTRN